MKFNRNYSLSYSEDYVNHIFADGGYPFDRRLIFKRISYDCGISADRMSPRINIR